MMDCPNLTLDAVLSVNGTAREETTAALVSNAINKYALPSVCAFGVVGNLLNLTILTRHKLQKSFRSLEQAANLCLIALALSDLLFCLVVIPSMFLPKDGQHSSENSLLAVYGLYQVFVINVFIMESTLLTVVMSLERFLAICFPLRQDLYLTTRRTKYVIVFTALFSLSFNIPVIFRYKMRPHCGLHNFNNLTFITTEAPSSSQPTSTLVYSLANRTRTSELYDGSGVDCPWGRNCIRSGRTVGEDKFIINTSRSLLSDSAFHNKSHSDTRSFRLPDAFLSAVTTSLTTATPKEQPPLHVAFTETNSASGTFTNSNQRPLYYTVEQVLIGDSFALDRGYRWAWAVAGNFVPLILLFYFNACLWWRIYLSYKLRRQFHQAPRSSRILTLTLIAIVVMFFILVAPTETVLTLKNSIPVQSDTVLAIEHVLNLMQAINFSVNFILYCIISPYFRKTLKYIMLCGLYNVYQTSSMKNSKIDCETSLM